jgi:Zn-finger nucleic acid-binding protein
MLYSITMSLKKEVMGKTVNCPRCWKEMVQAEIELFGPNITVDLCPNCSGLWLDQGELRKLLKSKKLTDYLTKDIGTKSDSKLVCPRCGGLMDLEMADDVEVDVCLNCSGVWLDQGELEELKLKSKEGFTYDEAEKAVEKWEDMVAKNRKSRFNKFLGRLGK